MASKKRGRRAAQVESPAADRPAAPATPRPLPSRPFQRNKPLLIFSVALFAVWLAYLIATAVVRLYAAI